MPGNRICAVLGDSKSGRTTLLQLITGQTKPDHGAVLSRMRLSPIANSAGFFHQKLSGFDNIASTARCYGMDDFALTKLAVTLPGFEGDLTEPVGKLNPKVRRGMETLLIALLPFDVYLLDDIERMAPEVLTVLLQILSLRGIGMIFTTRMPKLVQQHADCVSIIREKKLFAYETVDGILNHDAE